MPSLITLDGHRIDTPPGILQRDVDAEVEALIGLGDLIRTVAEKAIATHRGLDMLTNGGRLGAAEVDRLAVEMMERASDIMNLTADGERALMKGVR